ncbi:MAG: GNAT family N-acetyltransferase [Acidimicrobiales bacterium]
MSEIRKLTTDQWPVWRDVRLRALEEDPAAFGSTLADWSGSGDSKERWSERLDNVAANFVAFLPGGPVGQVSGGRTEQSAHVELMSMWVAPEARGTGVGDALVEAVERWARELGAESVALSVKVDNRPAIRLYERKGFARASTPARDGEYEMVKSLR